MEQTLRDKVGNEGGVITLTDGTTKGYTEGLRLVMMGVIHGMTAMLRCKAASSWELWASLHHPICHWYH